MAFKLPASKPTSDQTPESLFRDLRSRTVEGLMSQQADSLRRYMEVVDKPDVALELPTGSGKTLVGLLIAEWRRRSKGERCLYLCPTRQLVHQVVAQAQDKYGITAFDFTGSARRYDHQDKSGFKNCEAIGVATYSALFNTNPFFDDLDLIVFDDAHAAENYVSKLWSFETTKYNDEEIFNAIWTVIEPVLPSGDRIRFRDSSDTGDIDRSYVGMLSSFSFRKIKEELIAAIDRELTADRNQSTDQDLFNQPRINPLEYPWKMIKDHLDGCHLYYSSDTVLIRPLIAPTGSFAPFNHATQRVYMSATLGEGGDLERIFGRQEITRIPAPEGWDKQGIGRRFFLFPMRMLDEEASLELALDWANKLPRALVLTPSYATAESVQDRVANHRLLHDYTVFTAKELEESKVPFTSTDNAIAVLANRYDGIDLIGDECRFLVIYGLPEATNLQERFIITKFGASLLYRVRIRTRVTQAVGRCTRSAIDYAVVVVIGDNVHQFFHKPEVRRILHPEMQAEASFGVEQSKVDDVSGMEENIDHFLSKDADWQAAEQYILESRDQLEQLDIPFAESLSSVVKHEVRYQDAIWSGGYSDALLASKEVLSSLSGDELKGYRAMWNYLAGSAAMLHGDMPAARILFSAASATCQTLPWLKALREVTGDEEDKPAVEIIHGERIELLEQLFRKLGKANTTKLDKLITSVRTGLESTEAVDFESAQVNLGRLLGFHSGNSEEQGDPDPWWISGSRGIVFEDFTATGDSPVVSKKKTLQAKAHPDTLASKFPDVEFSVVFCTHSKRLDGAALPHTEGISYISVDDFQAFAEEAIKCIRELWNTFSEPGDLKWRELAARKLSDYHLQFQQVFERLSARDLISLAGESE